ncbi:MAG: HlyD family efflux transporter periplasmic adaptor subunit [Myxococcales bacterium]|nr:HlyD family efflux transporter periplasmic adaptor subunit [Myxococcales bacterium]
MRHEELSTHRKIAPAVLAPEYLEISEHVSEAPTHLAGQKLAPLPIKGPINEKTERSAHALKPSHHSVAAPAPRREPKATPAPLPVAQVVHTKSVSASERSGSKSQSKSQSSKSQSKAKSVAQPAPQAAAPQMPGMIDPLSVPVPPELGPTIYGWIRRLALQADLETADRVLREALTEISSSLSVTIVYPGQDGLWSLGGDNEIPREAGPIVAVAQARRAIIASHTALIPIVTTTETVAVILFTRNPRNPAYQPIEQLAMLGLARESAAILHHLVVQHMQKATELAADKGSLYRPEALEAHRGKTTEGSPIHISPVWVRRAYPLLVATILAALAFTIFIKVPTYSTGRGLVMLEGTTVTAPAMGTVDQVLVTPGQAVNAGTILVRLQASAEQDELVNVKAERDNAARAYLTDPSDENNKKQLASLEARLNTARSKLEQRTIRASKTGTISDIRTRSGALLQPGDAIVTIVDSDKTFPEVYAFLPATDRPRLRVGMELQVGLAGYTKTREKAIITFISREGVGSTEAAKILGPALADSLRLPPDGSYVWVKAKLPGRTFKTEHNTLSFHHGMQATTEVLISEKPFLISLLPALEKYIPD